MATEKQSRVFTTSQPGETDFHNFPVRALILKPQTLMGKILKNS